MPARKRSHWWVTGGAIAATVTTVLAGVVPALGYLHDLTTSQIQERSDWAAAKAVMQYRLDRDEQDLRDLKQEKCP